MHDLKLQIGSMPSLSAGTGVMSRANIAYSIAALMYGR
jgi:hypothetical protein